MCLQTGRKMLILKITHFFNLSSTIKHPQDGANTECLFSLHAVVFITPICKLNSAIRQVLYNSTIKGWKMATSSQLLSHSFQLNFTKTIQICSKQNFIAVRNSHRVVASPKLSPLNSD